MADVTNMSPYVIITPAYNEAKYIEMAIKSVISQTLRPGLWVIGPRMKLRKLSNYMPNSMNGFGISTGRKRRGNHILGVMFARLCKDIP